MPAAATKRTRNRPLTVLQEQFCLAYAEPNSPTWNNATKSGVAVGYSVNSASGTTSELIRKAKIQARISQIQARHQQAQQVSAVIDAATVRDDLISARERAKLAKDLSAEIRAVELLGKSIGLFRDGLELSATAARLSDDDRAELARIAAVLVERGIDQPQSEGKALPSTAPAPAPAAAEHGLAPGLRPACNVVDTGVAAPDRGTPSVAAGVAAPQAGGADDTITPLPHTSDFEALFDVTPVLTGT